MSVIINLNILMLNNNKGIANFVLVLAKVNVKKNIMFQLIVMKENF